MSTLEPFRETFGMMIVKTPIAHYHNYISQG